MGWWEFITEPKHSNAIMAVFTMLIFVATTAYAVISTLQWIAMGDQLSEMKKNNDMTRQQLVGTQAATFYFPEPKYDSLHRSLTFAMVNSGLVIGTLTKFDAVLQKKSLPDEKPIGPPIPIHIENRPINKGGTDIVEKGLPWSMPEVTDVRFWPGNEIVTIDGGFTYDNGFGELISQTFCFLWMAPWNLTMPAPLTGGWSGGQWGWGQGKQPCRTVKEMETEFSNTKRHIVDASTPKH